MALAPGTRIGNFEVVAPLGSGGMGEVYRARDTRLDRLVAIKSLPEGFRDHPERRARLEREAKLLASLNHANIGAIYGLEEVQGDSFLVLEFVGGETLSARLRRGPLSVRETLDVGTQIASAIESAHERGIVHRDLKPGNVMLTPSGTVKVLDFGLAKDIEPSAPSSGALSHSPTMPATAEGVIVGTAPYMSPEQVRGKGSDRRADVWALGCVLYECLTGRPAFAGETATDLVAQILEREPDWSALPSAVPPRLRDLLHRCLTKNAAERPRDIGDLGRELGAIAAEKSSAASSAATPSPGRPSLAVLYFQNLARDPESEYFCEGITEDILTDLSKIHGMRVASRNAVTRFRGAPADLHAVAAELGVGAVLEGSVRRVGDRVRITTQLVSAADGFQLWAERYDRTLQDVFAVQEEIAASIAAALKVALSPSEVKELGKDRPQDARAYDLYLKGRAEYARYFTGSFTKALGFFQEATRVDPDYALAWAGIADCHGQMVQWGTPKNEQESLRLGLEAARRAIELDPRLAEGHKALALVLHMAGDDEGHRGALLRAIEVNPRFVPALVNLGVTRFCDANLAASERFFRRVLEIDPQEAFATIWLAHLMGFTSRPAELMATTERVRQLTHDPFYLTGFHVIRSWLHLSRGDLAAAGQELREGRAAGCDAHNLRPIEIAIAARTGQREAALRGLHELEEAPALGTGAVLIAVSACERLGERDLALRFTERKVARDQLQTCARLDPELHGLLDRAPLAPRRRDAVLVWPLEAPMIDATRYALFREVRVESGIPQGSGLLGSAC